MFLHYYFNFFNYLIFLYFRSVRSLRRATVIFLQFYFKFLSNIFKLGKGSSKLSPLNMEDMMRLKLDDLMIIKQKLEYNFQAYIRVLVGNELHTDFENNNDFFHHSKEIITNVTETFQK